MTFLLLAFPASLTGERTQSHKRGRRQNPTRELHNNNHPNPGTPHSRGEREHEVKAEATGVRHDATKSEGTVPQQERA